MRWARRSAWLLGAATLVIAAAGLALMIWDWSAPVPRGFFGIRGFYGLFAVGFGGVGALLTWRRPGHPVGWLCAAAGLLEAVNFVTFEYGLAASVGRRLPGAGYVGWVELWIWVPVVTLVFVYLLLLFPDGRLFSPRWRPVGWLGGAFAVITVAGVALFPGSDRPNLPGLRNPFGVTLAVVPIGLAVTGLAGLVSCAVLAAWSLVVRSRRGTDLTRQQIKWLAWSGCLGAAALVPAAALSLTPGWPARVASGAAFAAVLAMPAAVGIAVLRYRLYDIDRVISRTLAYAIVTGVLAGLYAGLVLLATGVLGVRTPVAVAAATLAAAALFNPLRRRVQRAVDRRFNRARYDAEQTVMAFAARLKDAVDLDAVRDDLASVVQAALEPVHISVWTSESGWSSRNSAGPAGLTSPGTARRPGKPRAVGPLEPSGPARPQMTMTFYCVPQEVAMRTGQSPADTRMMGIVHAAFRRDLTRVRLVLTAEPVPQGGRRHAVADQVLWLMDRLHEHHHTEDDGLWPLVRQKNPAAAGLLEAMEAEHRAIVPAIEAVTAATQNYRSEPGDAARLELIQALDALTGVLLPHLDREVAEAMPVVAQTLTARDWNAWNKQANVKGKPLRELGLEGHWLVDEIDPAGYQVVANQVPAVPRFILLHGFARPYRRRRDAWWDPQVSAGRAAASP